MDHGCGHSTQYRNSKYQTRYRPSLISAAAAVPFGARFSFSGRRLAQLRRVPRAPLPRAVPEGSAPLQPPLTRLLPLPARVQWGCMCGPAGFQAQCDLLDLLGVQAAKVSVW